jgi:hypothetical protein
LVEENEPKSGHFGVENGFVLAGTKPKRRDSPEKPRETPKGIRGKRGEDSGEAGRLLETGDRSVRRRNVNDAAGYLNDRHPALQYGAINGLSESARNGYGEGNLKEVTGWSN